MPLPARRLFDVNGFEIHDSKEIRRDQDYFVSSAAVCKFPKKEISENTEFPITLNQQ
jgi:hypothetical protein